MFVWFAPHPSATSHKPLVATDYATWRRWGARCASKKWKHARTPFTASNKHDTHDRNEKTSDRGLNFYNPSTTTHSTHTHTHSYILIHTYYGGAM